MVVGLGGSNGAWTGAYKGLDSVDCQQQQQQIDPVEPG